MQEQCFSTFYFYFLFLGGSSLTAEAAGREVAGKAPYLLNAAGVAILDLPSLPSKIARKLTREMFDTSKDVFYNKLFVFEGFR